MLVETDREKFAVQRIMDFYRAQPTQLSAYFEAAWRFRHRAASGSKPATLAAALKVAENAPKGSVLLAMLPDTGERYLSTFLTEGMNEGSDDEWLASL